MSVDVNGDVTVRVQSNGVLEDHEVRRLILSLKRDDGTVEWAQAQTLVTWAEEALVNATLVEMMLSGSVRPSFNEDGEITVEKV